ncbi:dermonecrotic toxin domain-containing protein [Pseudomonas atacamensis]|uniref:dermonecrotic toxin domain-containing protein n=1 Tax=Pseudomonas atacamensis TaxID=2565368 RepID=UPI00382401B9
MLDPLTLDLPPFPPQSLATSMPLAKTIDQSLLLQANKRWRDSSDGLRRLFATSPALRDTINQSLRQQLQLDGEGTGLRFAATQTQAEHFVSLTQTCAFVVQHPVLETTLDELCHVIGLRRNHPLHGLKPLQLLEKLKALDPQKTHATAWAEFWEARAPHTAVSRRTQATRLYRMHFEATAEAAFARQVISAEQLDCLRQVIDADSAALSFKGRPLHTEKPALVLSNHSKVKLPGAWVISTGDRSTAPLVYLPCRPECIRAFEDRAQMEAWLASEVQIPTGLSREILRCDYTESTAPMLTGASDLFADRHHAQLHALHTTNRGRPGLRQWAAHALVQVDLIDHQRRNAIIVAAPARLSVDAGESDEKPVFGSLSAAIPLNVRHAALKREREALERLQANDPDASRYRQCKEAIKTLENAEHACDTAARSLLYRERAFDVATFNAAFTAIYQAHKDGLHAEARLQAALGLITDSEHELLRAVLQTPRAADRDADFAAASLSLSLTETASAITTVKSATLKGALVFTRTATLSGASPGSSLLLYCPGAGGGLQRFADQQALAREVLKIAHDDTHLSLRLNPVMTDPLHQSLDALISDFESDATALRGKPEQADAMEILRQRCLASVQVPVNAARSLAFAHVREQERSATLATHLPDWLTQLDKTARSRLKQRIEAYVEAMGKSHALMSRALEPRDDFTRKHLHARLRKDFAIDGHFSVQVELPDSTKTQTVVAAGPSGPRKTSVIVPGPTRSRMSLEDLAQVNIDNVQSVLNDALSQRLIFMRLEVTATLPRDRIRLLNGINLTYLRKVLPALDLPAAYERKIHEAFHGSASDSLFVRQHRRECLIEPWRLMLTIQSDNARLQKHLSHDETALLNTAIDADTADAWLAHGKRIVLLPVALKTGGKDTPREGPVTLSGLTFIEEQISGTTLLYLPDSPDQQYLRRYDSLEAARKGLFILCGNDRWIEYLAGKALQGDVRAHVRRIGEAVTKNFNAIIEVGARWPASTSLAAHLLDAQEGRLIEAHRGTSRSNDELFFERYALKGPRVFNYMKMALGMVPFVGTVLALHDAWGAANQAAAAFLRGDVAQGVAELQSMFLSLIDALMDLLPGEAVAANLSRTSRALTRTRQLRNLLGNVASLHARTQRNARQVLARFQDYDYEKPLSLAGIEPTTHGLYRGIYRHADGDFIERQGRVYQVELGQDSRVWRLSGNSRKTYKQPIALDESGHWDTWFGVHGTALEGGLLGGGNVAGHLADALDPYWPPVIRQHLPRWLSDRSLRRQQQLTLETERLARAIDARLEANKAALRAFHNAPRADQPALLPAAEAACLEDIRMATQRYQVLAELKPLTSGNKLASVSRTQSSVALRLTSRYGMRSAQIASTNLTLLEKIQHLSLSMHALPAGARSRRLTLLGQIRQLQIDYVKKMEMLEHTRNQLNHWYDLVSVRSDKSELAESVALINRQHSNAHLLYHKTYMQLDLVLDHRYTDDVSWIYFRERTAELWKEAKEAMTTQYDLPGLHTSAQNRTRMLQHCVDAYTRLRRQMTILTSDYPEHFHLHDIEPLLDNIEQMASLARRGVIEPPVPKAPGQPVQRVFLTAEGNLLYGTEKFDTQAQRRVYERQMREGKKQVWEEGPDGRSRLVSPPQAQPQAPQVDLDALVADAQRRLDRVPAYQTAVQRNADRGMLPVDLQHMMDTQASELGTRADAIAAKAAQHPLIQTLREKATELTAAGRTLRTQSSLASQKPTDGMLDDLIGQGAVEIRRTQPIRLLGRHAGHPDHMQEYEIWNLTSEPPQLLWYAHFHYRSATPVVNRFETAHLKLPQHRFLTHADDATLPYSKIGRQSVVLGHFEQV